MVSSFNFPKKYPVKRGPQDPPAPGQISPIPISMTEGATP